MSIPTFDDKTELRKVRTDTINPLVEKVNERFQEVVSTGQRCIVDYRKYELKNPPSTPGGTVPDFVEFFVELEANEFPVRCVVSSIVSGNEVYVPSEVLTFKRATNMLTVDVNAVEDGFLWLEYWKMI